MIGSKKSSPKAPPKPKETDDTPGYYLNVPHCQGLRPGSTFMVIFSHESDHIEFDPDVPDFPLNQFKLTPTTSCMLKASTEALKKDTADLKLVSADMPNNRPSGGPKASP